MNKLDSKNKKSSEVTLKNIILAKKRINDFVENIPLNKCDRLSKQYDANIYVKREDLQKVRSYKIRGAYNLMSSLTNDEKKKGVVCASAGNHAQGVAFSCNNLHIKGVIFVPVVTPKQKIDKINSFGNGWIELRTEGADFDEASKFAQDYCNENDMSFVHPFDDART
ncbi:pyridoxal-phosphate dependent enzyme, partial [archaeon]|nr:pyridoxal-phosphate dependent enzyme [archaeon]